MPRLSLGAIEVPYDGSEATRVFLLLGHPVSHSLSPRFQAAAFGALGLDAVYLACDVPPAALPAAMAALRDAAATGVLGGANVTIPHKTTVPAFLDDVDRQARVAGACNTIVVAPSAPAPRLLGHNTDVDGLLAVLEAEAVRPAGRPAVILGSGGMARAAVVAAARAGAAELRVLSRAAAKGQTMLAAVAAGMIEAPPRWRCASLDAVPPGFLDDAALLVQATSLGLGAGDPAPLVLRGAPRDLFVLETIYNPAETVFLRVARRAGLRAVNGLGLLVSQGAASLQLWCAREPPLRVMRRSVGLE
jgi:shikimate dehydrogenase